MYIYFIFLKMMIDLINYKFNIFCINESHIFFFIFRFKFILVDIFLCFGDLLNLSKKKISILYSYSLVIFQFVDRIVRYLAFYQSAPRSLFNVNVIGSIPRLKVFRNVCLFPANPRQNNDRKITLFL